MIVFTSFGPGAAAWPPGLPLPTPEGPRTALRVTDGQPRHLSAHLDRLQSGARALGEPAPWIPDIEQDLLAWIALRADGNWALRLRLHTAWSLVHASLEPLPANPHPYRLVPLLHPLGDLRTQDLARHKGLSGPWRQPALAEARRRGGQDALVLWPDGTLAETTLAAIGLEREGMFLLPPPEGRVASLTEAIDLPDWARDRGLAVRREPISLAQAQGAHLWCLNAVRGIWPAMLL